MVRTSEYDIARARGEGNIYFMVHTTTRGQSVYPDIALYYVTGSISVTIVFIELKTHKIFIFQGIKKP